MFILYWPLSSCIEVIFCFTVCTCFALYAQKIGASFDYASRRYIIFSHVPWFLFFQKISHFCRVLAVKAAYFFSRYFKSAWYQPAVSLSADLRFLLRVHLLENIVSGSVVQRFCTCFFGFPPSHPSVLCKDVIYSQGVYWWVLYFPILIYCWGLGPCLFIFLYAPWHISLVLDNTLPGYVSLTLIFRSTFHVSLSAKNSIKKFCIYFLPQNEEWRTWA